MSDYTFETSVQTRFRDIDIRGQVHNAVYLIYVEEARAEYYDTVVGTSIDEMNSALVHQSIDYERSISYPETLTVRHRITRLGESSQYAAFEIESPEGLAAEGTGVQVNLDESGDPAPMPAEWIERIEDFEDAPVETP